MRKALIGLHMLLVISCSSAKRSSVGDKADDIRNKRWFLHSIAGDTIRLKKQPFILFTSENRMSAFGGCNAYSGQYTYVDNKLTVANLTGNLMDCDSSNPEMKFMRALEQVDGLDISGDEMELLKNGFSILRFTSRPPDSRR